jgi:hypothetical protein
LALRPRSVFKVRALGKDMVSSTPPLLILCLLLLSSYAATDVTLSIDPTESTAGVGETFTIEVEVSGVSELYGWQLELSFNQAILRPVEVIEGDFLKSKGQTLLLGENNFVDGKIGPVGCSLLGAESSSGSGVLMFVSFEVVGEGSSTLKLENTMLLDPAGKAIEHSTTPGFFSTAAVQGIPVYLVAGVLVVLGALAGMLARKYGLFER